MVAAGTMGNLMYYWVYRAPGGVSRNAPLSAGESKFLLGYMVDSNVNKEPSDEIVMSERQDASSALPGGFYAGKRAVWLTPLTTITQPIDAVPFFLGNMKLDTPTGTEDYLMKIDPSGDSEELIWGEEHNRLASDWARNYYSKCVKSSMSFVKGFLQVEQEHQLSRQFTMQDASPVVRTTFRPIRRGDNSPLWRYTKAPKAGSITCNWHFAAGSDIDLSAVFSNVAFSWESQNDPAPEDDGNDYLPAQQPNGKVTLSAITLDLELDVANAILPTLRVQMNKVKGSLAGDYLNLKVCRLHADDWIDFRWIRCILQKLVYPLEESDGKSYGTVKAIFAGARDFEVRERQCDIDGNSTINTDTTYAE